MNQELQVIPLLGPADIQSAGSSVSFNMGKLHSAKIIVIVGAVTGDNPLFLLYAGATKAAATTELAFKWRKAGADNGAAGSDVFGARTAQAADGTGLLLGVAATADLRTYTIDLETADMPEGKPWVTLFFDDGSASALFASIVAIGWPRYQGDTHVTAQ